MTENEGKDETTESSAAVESKAVGKTTADAPKPVKRKKAAEVPPPSPTAAAQAIFGLKVTGTTDHALKSALRAFQRAQGLTVHGRLDDATKKSLGITT